MEDHGLRLMPGALRRPVSFDYREEGGKVSDAVNVEEGTSEEEPRPQTNGTSGTNEIWSDASEVPSEVYKDFKGLHEEYSDDGEKGFI